MTISIEIHRFQFVISIKSMSFSMYSNAIQILCNEWKTLVAFCVLPQWRWDAEIFHFFFVGILIMAMPTNRHMTNGYHSSQYYHQFFHIVSLTYTNAFMHYGELPNSSNLMIWWIFLLTFLEFSYFDGFFSWESRIPHTLVVFSRYSPNFHVKWFKSLLNELLPWGKYEFYRFHNVTPF